MNLDELEKLAEGEPHKTKGSRVAVHPDDLAKLIAVARAAKEAMTDPDVSCNVIALEPLEKALSELEGE